MDEKIENFLEKWDEMVAAATDIKEFKYKFEVSITSVDSLRAKREETIDGINRAFSKYNMNYTSSSTGKA